MPAIYRSEFTQARRWLAALPPESLKASPILLVAQVWHSARYISLAQAEQLVNDAQFTLESSQTTPQESISGHIGALQTVLSRSRGDTRQEQLLIAESALSLIPANELRLRSMVAFRIGLDHFDLGQELHAIEFFQQAKRLGLASENFYAVLGSVYVWAITLQRWGQLTETTALCHRVLQEIPPDHHKLPIFGALPITLGGILLEGNDLDQAERFLHQGLALDEPGGL